MRFDLFSRLRNFFTKKQVNNNSKTDNKAQNTSFNRQIDDKPFMPWSEVTSERESELIDGLAKQVVDHGLEFPTNLFLEVIRPAAFIGSRLGLNYFAPFLELFGISGYEYSIIFEKEENIKRLIRRIEELST